MMTKQSTTWLLLVNITLYAVCFMAQAPVLPYLVKELGAGATGYGAVQTTLSIMNFVGGLLAGPLVDKYGGRALLLCSFAAAAASYGLTASATTMWMLYASRLPTVLQHAVLAARCILTANSDPSSRATQLGAVGIAYGVGFAVGPALGGVISQHSLRTGAQLATAGSLLSVALILLFIPADLKVRSRPKYPADVDAPATTTNGHVHAPADVIDHANSSQLNGTSHTGDEDGGGQEVPDADAAVAAATATDSAARPSYWGSFLTVLQQPRMPQLLTCKVLASLAMALFQSMFGLMLSDVYGLSSKGNGYVLSYVGILVIAVQALLIKPVSRHVQEWTAIKFCSISMFIGYLGLAHAFRLWHVLLALLPIAAGGVTAATINTAQLTKAVPSHLTGTVLSVDMSVGSGVRVVAPALGALLVRAFGFPAIGMVSSVLVGVLLCLVHTPWIEAEQNDPASKRYEKFL